MTALKTTKPLTKKSAAKAPETTITAYKGFGPDWKCIGFQYEVGKTYEHSGPVQACATGFHACENPMDVWSYYPLTDSKFAVVELSGELSRHGDDSKIAAGRITIKAEIGLPQFVAESIKYVINLCKNAKDGEAASGYGSTQAASGNYSTQAASGDDSKQAASGYGSTQAASGDDSKQAASGYGSKQAASGDDSKQAASGYGSKQAASGDDSTQAASGDDSTQAASGYGSKQAASGNYSTQAASGDGSTQAASGDDSTQAASGYGSTQAASGDDSTQEITGKNGVIMAAGSSARAKASDGGCFALRWDDDSRPRIIIGYVGEDGVKPDTWYRVKDGALVECE